MFELFAFRDKRPKKRIVSKLGLTSECSKFSEKYLGEVDFTRKRKTNIFFKSSTKWISETS